MIHYTNRKGQTYYLKTGTTKTGKPRYYASTDPKKGTNAGAMPGGYVFRENVNAQVSVGKKQPQQIEDSELNFVRSHIKKLKCDCREENKGKSIVLHTADRPEKTGLSSFFNKERLVAYHEQHALYQPMLRFTLIDKTKRYFQTERMCFLGEPDWIWIGEPGSLELLSPKYIPLLDNHEALFEKF